MTKLWKLSGKIWFHRAKALAELQRYDEAANSIEKSLEMLDRHDDAEFTEAVTLLSTYLVEAGHADRLYNWLTNFDFMESKLSAFGLQALMEDYDLAKSFDSGIAEQKAKVLNLIQGALRLSSHVLNKYPAQLATQLTGRLLSFQDSSIQNLLKQARRKKTLWLRPFYPTLIPPGGSLIQTLDGHLGAILAIDVTPDGQRAISS